MELSRIKESLMAMLPTSGCSFQTRSKPTSLIIELGVPVREDWLFTIRYQHGEPRRVLELSMISSATKNIAWSYEVRGKVSNWALVSRKLVNPTNSVHHPNMALCLYSSSLNLSFPSRIR